MLNEYSRVVEIVEGLPVEKPVTNRASMTRSTPAHQSILVQMKYMDALIRERLIADTSRLSFRLLYLLVVVVVLCSNFWTIKDLSSWPEYGSI